MAFGLRLPDSAPFSPNQRAWLDGYIAGRFSVEIDNAGDLPVVDGRVAAAVEVEDFPWHDPTLVLEERLALAAGRRPERVLMAAMAQLDCGQCGYLCQTYAEAITRGEEKSLTRCMPGGKATSRKLKELIGSGLVSAAPAPVTAAAAPQLPPGDPPDRHFSAVFHGADCLNGAGSEKETRHVILASRDGEYQPGDSLGVVARNSAELVAAIIERLGARPEVPVLSPDGIERPLVEALSEGCEIGLEPGLPEALFNRGLVFERLGLCAAAVASWDDYLAIDASSSMGSRSCCPPRQHALPLAGLGTRQGLGDGRRRCCSSAP